MIAHFNQYYVKTGIFDAEASKIIRHASVLREQADYEDFFEATEIDAAESYEQGRQFIKLVDDYLKNKLI